MVKEMDANHLRYARMNLCAAEAPVITEKCMSSQKDETQCILMTAGLKPVESGCD